MTHVKTTVVALIASITLVGGLVLAPAPTQALATPSASVARAATPAQTVAAKPKGKIDRFIVSPGVTFSSPINKDQKRKIISKINRVIRHTPRGSEIRIFSWKIWTRAGVNAILDAQKRGVKIRVIMDKKNTVVEYNPHFPRLKRGLIEGNKKAKPGRKSYARLCSQSCRGPGGAAHSKFMLFSQSGRSKGIYMSSSANWGDPAANLQWNDLYTFVRGRGIYGKAVEVFDQAWKDTPAFPRYEEFTTADKKTTVGWTPQGNGYVNRLLITLKRTKCKGATNGAGNANGRTVIRVAPDVVRGQAGLAAAKQLSRLWAAGCDVKVGYTILGRDVSQQLKKNYGRGPVPIRHLVQDFDGDGIFDRYFHLKTWTINGVIGKNPTSYWTQIGSANISNLARVSDEQFVWFFNQRKVTKAYQNHINYWFDHFPASTTSRIAARAVADGTVDPYATMEQD